MTRPLPSTEITARAGKQLFSRLKGCAGRCGPPCAPEPAFGMLAVGGSALSVGLNVEDCTEICLCGCGRFWLRLYVSVARAVVKRRAEYRETR